MQNGSLGYCHSVGQHASVSDMTALDEARRLGARRAKLEAELDAVRQKLPGVVRAAVDEGARQVDIVEATGYTREMIRRMLLPPGSSQPRKRKAAA